MESYVEISYVIQALTMMISCMVAGYLSLQPLSMKQMLLYSLIVPLLACLLWIKNSEIYMLIIEVLFFLLYFRLRWKTFLGMLTLRFLLSFSWYVWYRGGFHNFQYFFPLKSPVMLVIFQVIVLWLLYRKWNYWLGKLNYVYECKMKELGSNWMKGYLDSGNLLRVNDTPVVFIDEQYRAYFKNENIQYVVMNTMGSQIPIGCYESCLQIRGWPVKKVLVCCQKGLQLPMHCQVLLNINLWLE